MLTKFVSRHASSIIRPAFLSRIHLNQSLPETVFSSPTPGLTLGARHSSFLQLDRLSFLQRPLDERHFSSATLSRVGQNALIRPTADFRAAAALFDLSARSGNIDAQFALGVMHHAGLGVPRDSELGTHYLRLAAAKGHPRAKYCYGLCLREGLGVPPDVTEAMAELRKAAEAGYEEAMFVYGCSLLGGIGVNRDEKTAYSFFQKAAQNGHPPSILWEGVCLHDGLGVKQDKARAMTAFREASSKGLPEAAEALRIATEWSLGRDFPSTE
jgi:TPR repeat protein